MLWRKNAGHRAIHPVFIAALIGQTKVLASALRTFQEFEGISKEKVRKLHGPGTPPES